MAEVRVANAHQLLPLVEECEQRILGYRIEQGVHLRGELEAALAQLVSRGARPLEYADAMLERLDTVEPEHVAETVATVLRQVNADLAFSFCEKVFEGVIEAEISQCEADKLFEQVDRDDQEDARLEAELSLPDDILRDSGLPSAKQLHEGIEADTKAITDLQLMLDACKRCKGPGYETSGDYTGPVCTAPFEEVEFEF
jgi:hypothetical protein